MMRGRERAVSLSAAIMGGSGASPPGGAANPPALPPKLIKYEAERANRLHHFLWHQLRNNWWAFPEDVRPKVRALGWEPPRPSQDERSQWVHDNGAGEDFLYMHRQMIAKANSVLVRCGADPVKGWPDQPNQWEIPRPGDSTYPVPPMWTVQPSMFRTRVETLKSDAFYYVAIQEWAWTFKDLVYLRSMSLGEVGSRVESTIHNSMHNRWADTPWVPADKPTDHETGGRPGREIDDQAWDCSKYDFLIDTYSSHVNGIFWKIHGWVDGVVDRWAEAHGSRITRIQKGGVEWFAPDGVLVRVSDPWVGGMAHHHCCGTESALHCHADDDLETMQLVAEIITGSKTAVHYP